MKCLFCTKCGDLVALRNIMRSCECGNTSGVYIDNITIEVAIDDPGTVKIVGIANSFLINEHMHFDDGVPGSFNDDPNLSSLFNKRKSPIIIVPPYTTGDVKKKK